MSDDPVTHTDPHTDPASAWYWPDAPPQARFHGNALGPKGFGWFVEGIAPPGPWPFAAEFPGDAYGPPGTEWHIPPSAYENRLLEGSATLTQAVVKRFLRLNKLPELAVLPVGSILWTTPGKVPYEMTIDVLRATVHAKVGTLEESCNVLHYIPDPEDAITPGMVDTFGLKVVAQWQAFLNGVKGAARPQPTSVANVKGCFGGNTVFDEVRAAHVQIIGGKVKWAPGTNTSFNPFPAGLHSNTNALPAQVAATLTFHTGVRVGKKGRSGRGRAYLGPLSTGSIDTDGLLGNGIPELLADNFRSAMVTGMDAGGDKFKLVVLSPATNARYLVTDVLCGMVPDTQRRRRKSLLERYATAV